MNNTLVDRLLDIKENFGKRLIKYKNSEYPLGFTGGLIVALFVSLIILGWFWSQEPEAFDVTEISQQLAPETSQNIIIGSTTTATSIHLMETLLNKPGGYLSNDILPPSIWLDNMPNWEYGVLIQSRDMARSMRNDFSRSQSQSVEDKDLIIA